MRTTTSGEDAALLLLTQQVPIDFEVEDHLGMMVSYASHASGNFILGGSFRGSREEPIMTGEIRLRREMGGVSLAPLMNDDVPITAGRRCRLKLAVGARGADLSSDYVTIFDGYVGPDDPAVGGNESVMTVPFRDPGGRLADRFISDTFTYSAGLTMLEVSQEWLNDSFPGADTDTGTFAASASGGNGGASAFTRASGSFVTDGFQVGDWVTATGFVTAGNNGIAKVTHVASGVLTVAKTLTDDGAAAGCRVRRSEFPIFVRGAEPTATLTADASFGDTHALSGLNTISAFMGGQTFRHYWNTAEGRFHLYLYEPSGIAETSLITFTPRQYYQKPSVQLHKYGIRDRVIVRYTDDTGDTVTAAQERLTLPTYPVEMVLDYTNDPQVRGTTRAQAIADGAFRDVSEPVFTQTCEHPTFWPIEIEDTVTYAADGKLYKDARKVVVAGFEHRFEAGDVTTTIHARGQVPLGSASRWHIIRRNKQAATTIEAFTPTPPSGAGIPEFLENGELSANLFGSPNVTNWKFLGDPDDYPSVEDVLLETAVIGQNLTTAEVGSLILAANLPAPGELAFITAIPITGTNIAGEPVKLVAIVPSNVPGIDAKGTLTAAGVASAIASADDGWASVKAFAKIGSKPSEAEVDGETAVNLTDGEADEADFGTLLTAEAGNEVHWAFKFFPEVDGAGDASRIIRDHKTFGVGEDGIGPGAALANIGDGGILANFLSKQGQSWAFDSNISPTSASAVSWGPGTLRFADGTTVSIASGSVSGLLAGTTRFIYWPGTGTTLLTTASQATAIGENNVIIATVWKNSDDDNTRDAIVLTSPNGLGDSRSISIDAEIVRSIRLEVIQAVVAALSAITADIGTITAGEITVGSMRLSADDETLTFGDASAPLVGDGIFQGLADSLYQFRVGDPAGQYIHYDGAGNLVLNEVALSAATGTFSGDLAADLATFRTLETTTNNPPSGWSTMRMSSGEWLGDDTPLFEMEIFSAGPPATRDHYGAISLDSDGLLLIHSDDLIEFSHDAPTVSGSKGGNAALGNLITELATMGLIVDGTS